MSCRDGDHEKESSMWMNTIHPSGNLIILKLLPPVVSDTTARVFAKEEHSYSPRFVSVDPVFRTLTGSLPVVVIPFAVTTNLK